MNERIKLLAEQATNDVKDEFDHWINSEFNKEKFAELIVKEMLQTCEDHPSWSGRMIGEQIKEHFGVTE